MSDPAVTPPESNPAPAAQGWRSRYKQANAKTVSGVSNFKQEHAIIWICLYWAMWGVAIIAPSGIEDMPKGGLSMIFLRYLGVPATGVLFYLHYVKVKRAGHTFYPSPWVLALLLSGVLTYRLFRADAAPPSNVKSSSAGIVASPTRINAGNPQPLLPSGDGHDLKPLDGPTGETKDISDTFGDQKELTFQNGELTGHANNAFTSHTNYDMAAIYYFEADKLEPNSVENSPDCIFYAYGLIQFQLDDAVTQKALIDAVNTGLKNAINNAQSLGIKKSLESKQKKYEIASLAQIPNGTIILDNFVKSAEAFNSNDRNSIVANFEIVTKITENEKNKKNQTNSLFSNDWSDIISQSP